MDGKYHSVCRTCEEEHFTEVVTEAEAFFRRHEHEGHRVETLDLTR